MLGSSTLTSFMFLDKWIHVLNGGCSQSTCPINTEHVLLSKPGGVGRGMTPLIKTWTPPKEVKTTGRGVDTRPGEEVDPPDCHCVIRSSSLWHDQPYIHFPYVWSSSCYHQYHSPEKCIMGIVVLVEYPTSGYGEVFEMANFIVRGGYGFELEHLTADQVRHFEWKCLLSKHIVIINPQKAIQDGNAGCVSTTDVCTGAWMGLILPGWCWWRLNNVFV